MSAPAKQPTVDPDWADDKAAEFVDFIVRCGPHKGIATHYLAAELRIIREEGVSEGIDRLGTQLGVGIFA
jgi:hypothetical protein